MQRKKQRQTIVTPSHVFFVYRLAISNVADKGGNDETPTGLSTCLEGPRNT